MTQPAQTTTEIPEAPEVNDDTIEVGGVQWTRGHDAESYAWVGQYLTGLNELRYVYLYPSTGDQVLIATRGGDKKTLIAEEKRPSYASAKSLIARRAAAILPREGKNERSSTMPKTATKAAPKAAPKSDRRGLRAVTPKSTPKSAAPVGAGRGRVRHSIGGHSVCAASRWMVVEHGFTAKELAAAIAAQGIELAPGSAGSIFSECAKVAAGKLGLKVPVIEGELAQALLAHKGTTGAVETKATKAPVVESEPVQVPDLAAVMAEAGLSQAQAATMAGVTRYALRKALAGDAEQAAAIASKLLIEAA